MNNDILSQSTGFEIFIDICIHREKIFLLADLFFVSKEINKYIESRIGSLKTFICKTVDKEMGRCKYTDEKYPILRKYAAKSRKVIFFCMFYEILSTRDGFNEKLSVSCAYCHDLEKQERYQEINDILYKLIENKRQILQSDSFFDTGKEREFTEEDALCRIIMETGNNPYREAINIFISICREYDYNLGNSNIKHTIVTLEPTEKSFESLRISIQDDPKNGILFT